MRPRQSSLGITQDIYNVYSALGGFNEAEAIKPRNPTHTPDHLRRVPRFNEAEAIKPRNLPGWFFQNHDTDGLQ